MTAYAIFINRQEFWRLAPPTHHERIPASGGTSDEKIAAVKAECKRLRQAAREEANVNRPPKRAYN